MMQQAKATASVVAAEAISELAIGDLLAEDDSSAYLGLELAHDANEIFTCRGCSPDWHEVFASALEDVVTSQDVTFALGSWSASLWKKAHAQGSVSILEVEELALQRTIQVVLDQRETTYRSIAALRAAGGFQFTARDLTISLSSCLKQAPWMGLNLEPSNDLYLLELREVINLYAALSPSEQEALNRDFSNLFQHIASKALKQYALKHQGQFPAPGSWPLLKATKFSFSLACTIQ